MSQDTPSNFAPLEPQIPDIASHGKLAEQVFARDPRAAMMHLRLFGESLSKQLVRDHRLTSFQETQHERLRRLRYEANLTADPLDWFHRLREEGNRAVHGDDVTHGNAMRMLKAAHRLSTWYWAGYAHNTPPKPGPFVKPLSRDERTRSRIDRVDAEIEQREAARAVSELDAIKRLFEMPEVAINRTLEACYQGLAPEVQAKVEAFLGEFKEEPIHEDRPLEQPSGMADDKVRLVGLDDLFFVVIAPPRGEILLVVYLAAREAAEAWARSKRFEVNKVFGSVQVYDAVEAETLAASFAGGLFDEQEDADLIRVGLPEALIHAVRAVGDELELDTLAPSLPADAADALYLLACGYSVDQTLRELDKVRPPREEVDEQDFAAAIHHPESKRSFVVLDDDATFDEVMAGSVDAWRVYLHPDQRRMVRMKANGPIRILGGAGTGKTVALLHRARHLLNEVFTEPDDRLLITTFTRNLAADLEHQLKTLVGDDLAKRVTVTNLHAYIAQLWSEHGTGQPRATDAQTDAAWLKAQEHDTLDMDLEFYRDEWTLVAQAQDVETEKDYFRAVREGRGVRLSARQRRATWQVFAAYREALDERDLLEAADQMRLLRRGIEDGTIPRPYISVLVDEVQDMGAPELRFLRGLVAEGPSDMFLVGDAHQRIYGQPTRMSRCGIEIRGRAKRLRVNYRTTAHVRRFAVSALSGETYDDLDGGEDTLDGYRSVRVGSPPTVHHSARQHEERQFILATLQDWLTTGKAESICVATRTNGLRDELQEFLSKNDVETSVIESDASATGSGVRLATFHRLKGLEFPRVLLSGVQQHLMPLRIPSFYRLDATKQAAWDKSERCLLYVASTRARDELVVTGYGQASPFLVGG